MKLTALLVLLCVNILSSQEGKSLLNNMIATEFSFASYAAEHGTRDAFIQFIADDGILFRPNAVNGKKFLIDSKPSKGLLSWYPIVAEISKAGDLGFTSGPWEYRKGKDSSTIAFGNFCTVWELQKYGTWKFAIDFGNSNDKPKEELKPLDYNKSLTYDFEPVGLASENVEELIALDKEISNLTSEKGLEQSYKPFISSSSRLLRNGVFPIIGVDNISAYLQLEKGRYEFLPMAGKISSSNDLGFTYGVFIISKKEENKTTKFNYMHIWQKDESGWKIAIDVIDELP